MLHRIVAGPSRAASRTISGSRIRRFTSTPSPLAAPATATSSEVVQENEASSSTCSPSQDSSNQHTNRIKPSRAYADYDADIQRLNRLATRPRPTSSDQAITYANDAWMAYVGLSPNQRRSLPLHLKRLVLRAIVPRFDSTVAIANSPSLRERARLNDLTAKRWERRLRTVMSDMLKSAKGENGVDFSDWKFILRSLAVVGHVTACEAVVKEMPELWRHNIVIVENCLTAITRYCRDLIESSYPRPKPEHVNHSAKFLHQLFLAIQSSDNLLRGSSLDILLTAVQRVRGLALKVGVDLVDQDMLKNINETFIFVLRRGYGFDIDSLAHLPSEANDFAPVTPYMINAVLDYMRTRGDSPFRLLAAFEVLSARQEFVPDEAMWDEDEEDIPTLSSLTAAEEAQSTSWFDQQKTSTVRTAVDFLSSLSSPTKVQPEAGSWTKLPYNPMSVLILIRSACDAGDVNLAIQILCNAIYSAKESRIKWLSQYKAISKNSPVWEPGLRISSKWFPPVFSASRADFGRQGKRLAALASDALDWAKEELQVLEESESNYLSGQLKPRRLRNLRNAGAYIGFEHRVALKEEIEELEKVLVRAEQLASWRVARRVKARARKYEEVRQAERLARMEMEAIEKERTEKNGEAKHQSLQSFDETLAYTS